MASFGDFLFGFGFNAILPDIHASLHEKSAENSRKDMKKTLTGAYSFAYPAYMVVAMVGYAAFGYKVQSNIFLSIDEILPRSAMIVIWALLAIKTATEAAVFNQAAFTLTRDVLGLTLDEDHVDHHPKNWKIDYVIRVIWCILAAVVAIFLPYVSEISFVEHCFCSLASNHSHCHATSDRLFYKISIFSLKTHPLSNTSSATIV